MLSAMAPEMSQDLRKKIIYLHKKGEGYKKISKALQIFTKVVQIFKKMELQPSHRDVQVVHGSLHLVRSVFWWEGLKKIDMQVHCSYLKK